MRSVIAFHCAGETLLGTLDDAPGTTGLLIVSGGNEIRIGAHRGMASLAAALAAAGTPVFRYDRRGIGDSTGQNGGFATSAPDITAALGALRTAMPQLGRIIAFGNCDAATALALFGQGVGIAALILANPWVVEPTDALPPPAAIRAHYAQRLRDPAEWRRLLTGGVNLGKLARGLLRARAIPRSALADRFAAGLTDFVGPITILTAERDATALGFIHAWSSAPFSTLRVRANLHQLSSASHSFSTIADKIWLEQQIIAALAE